MQESPGVFARTSLYKVALGLSLPMGLLSACAFEDDPGDIGRYETALSVGSYVEGTCSLGGVLGLSLQIAEEVSCLAPGTLVPFEPVDGISYGSAVIPYLSPEARGDLLLAAASSTSPLVVNSAYRTVVQQYLLYRWYQQGRCGITAAATPGTSNHESGRALDIGNYSTWSSVLPTYRWTQNVPGDQVHFEHLESPDLRGLDVLAFQMLWNRNNPGDLLAEDGIYGPQTRARIEVSPGEGFALGADCGEPYGGELVALTAPNAASPGQLVDVVVEVHNTGTSAWQPGSTFLGTTEPRDRDSPFYDDATWPGPHRPATVAEPTEPGAIGRFAFSARMPAQGDVTVSERFELVEEGVTWFGPVVPLEIFVGDGAPPFDDVDPDHEDWEIEPDEAHAGCAAAGGAQPVGLMLVTLLCGSLGPRRRKRPL